MYGVNPSPPPKKKNYESKLKLLPNPSNITYIILYIWNGCLAFIYTTNVCIVCIIIIYIYTYVHPCAECICMQVYDGVLEKNTSELYTFGSWSVCRDCLVLERGPRPWHTSVYWLVVLIHAILFKIQRWSSSSSSSSSGWWYTYKYPSQKYEFVSWDTIWWEKKKKKTNQS